MDLSSYLVSVDSHVARDVAEESSVVGRVLLVSPCTSSSRSHSMNHGKRSAVSRSASYTLYGLCIIRASLDMMHRGFYGSHVTQLHTNHACMSGTPPPCSRGLEFQIQHRPRKMVTTRETTIFAEEGQTRMAANHDGRSPCDFSPRVMALQALSTLPHRRGANTPGPIPPGGWHLQ